MRNKENEMGLDNNLLDNFSRILRIFFLCLKHQIVFYTFSRVLFFVFNEIHRSDFNLQKEAQPFDDSHC